MGNLFSRESPAMEGITRHHRETELERENTNLKAEINELKAKEATTMQTNQETAESMNEYIRGVRPTQWPTPQQFVETKKQYKYSPETFHIAISGMSGTGKSSLINSLRGLHQYDKEAAATRDVECTLTVTRYPDPDRKNLVWFDVPGAGTQSHPEAEYFNDKGLYIFDAILVLIGDRFGSTDITILRQCALYKIPAYIVRSKADVYVRTRYQNALAAERSRRKKEKRCGLSSDEKARLFEDQKHDYENAVRESVKQELIRAELPVQPVFIVSEQGLFSERRGMMSRMADGMENESEDNGFERDEVGDEDSDGDEDDTPYVVFDEERLLADLIHTSYLTRVVKDSGWLGSITDSLKKSWTWYDWFSKKFPLSAGARFWTHGPQETT